MASLMMHDQNIDLGYFFHIICHKVWSVMSKKKRKNWQILGRPIISIIYYFRIYVQNFVEKNWNWEGNNSFMLG